MSDFKLEWKGDLAKEIVRESAIKALLKSAADLQGKSAEQAPKDNGDLERNCNVSPLQENTEGIYVTVGYDLPYARRQHEGLHFKHPKKGKAKFLEDPFKANARMYAKWVHQKVRETIGD